MKEYVSVIIPTYNRAKTIEKSVRSVLAQTYKEFELIILDDGSTDNTKEVIELISDSRIKYYCQENAGAGAARNAGVEHASYDIIAFHDSDDIWMPDKLEKQMDYWKKHPEHDIIYCGFTLHCQDNQNIYAPIYDDREKLSGDIFDVIVYKNMVNTPTMLMKKAVFEEVGGFDVSVNCLEDWELALRIAEKHTFGFIDESLVDTFQTEGSVSTRTAEYYKVKCQMIIRYKDYLLKNNMFDSAVLALFESARNAGIESQIKQLFLILLQNSN